MDGEELNLTNNREELIKKMRYILLYTHKICNNQSLIIH